MPRSTLPLLLLLLLVATHARAQQQPQQQPQPLAPVNGTTASKNGTAAADKPKLISPSKPGSTKASLTLNRDKLGGLRRPKDAIADLLAIARRERKAVRAILKGQPAPPLPPPPPPPPKKDGPVPAGAPPPSPPATSGDCYQSLLMSPLLGTLCLPPTGAPPPPPAAAPNGNGK